MLKIVLLSLISWAALGSADDSSKIQIGNAPLINGKVTAHNKTLKPGDPIFWGDVVQTADHSSARLLMKDDSILDIAAASTVTLNDYLIPQTGPRKVDISADVGTLRALINQRTDPRGRFLVRTKSSVLLVTGTELVVSSAQTSDTLSEKFTMIQGHADLTAGNNKNSVPMETGTQFSITLILNGNIVNLDSTGVQLAKPVQLTPEQSAELAKTTTTEDKTFLQAVSTNKMPGAATLISVPNTLKVPFLRLKATDIPTPGVIANKPIVTTLRCDYSE